MLQLNRFQTAFRGVVVGALVVCAGAMATPSLARDHGGDPPHMGLFAGHPERLNRMLSSVDATPQQREQVQKIATQAAADLKPQADTGRALHQQTMAALTAPVVDANALEAIRQQKMAHHDVVSRRVNQALLDISRVLTPEQRVKLAERIKKHHDKHASQEVAN
jgi:periplasmic protein CpxP/Spy